MRRRLLMSRKIEGTILPSGFTQLNYLKSTGTQYIDLGFSIYSLENPSVEMEMKPLCASDGYAIVGVYRSGEHFQMGVITGRTIFLISTKSILNNVKVDMNEFHTFHMQSGLQTCDDIVIARELTDATTHNYNFLIFGRYRYVNGAMRIEPSPMAIRQFEIKDGEELVMKLIPAQRNSDGVLGMYDIVSQMFLTNAGTDEFTGG